MTNVFCFEIRDREYYDVEKLEIVNNEKAIEAIGATSTYDRASRFSYK